MDNNVIGEDELAKRNDEFLGRLIANELLTIEEILDEENILNTVRLKSEIFSTYFLNHTDLLQSMIHFAVRDYKESENTPQMIKYSFLSSEIIGSEIEGIINLFFDESMMKSRLENEILPEEPEENMDMEGAMMGGMMMGGGRFNFIEKKKVNYENCNNLHFLFDYIDHSNKLNYTSYGYFTKIINAILNKRFHDMVSYFEKYKHLMDILFLKLKFSYISDLIARFLKLDNPNLLDNYNKNELIFWDFRVKILDKIMSVFLSTKNTEEIHNISMLLTEVISKTSRINGGKELLNLINKKYLDSIFKIIQTKNQVYIDKSYRIIEALMEFFLNKETPFLTFVNCSKSIEISGGLDVFKEEAEQPLEDIMTTTIPEILRKYLIDIIAFIKEEENSNQIFPSTFGTKTIVFGVGRLRILYILSLSFGIEEPKIISTLCEENILELLLGLMSKYEWNNLMHKKICEIFFSVLEGKIIEYKKSLFEKCDFPNTVIKVMTMEDYVMPNKHQRKLKRGNTGYIADLANKLVEVSRKDPFISQKISQNSEFDKFANTTLKNFNEINNKCLGGYDPRDLSHLDSSFEKQDPGEIEVIKINEVKSLPVQMSSKSKFQVIESRKSP